MEKIIETLMGFWWLIPILLIGAFLKSPTGKGIIGEFIINLAFKFRLDNNEYHLIKSVTLPTEDGTTQLDHIIVSRFGIFVIETKNYKGWITGGEHKKMWTQTIFKTKNQFQNPLHQNYKHTRTLESLLGLPEKSVKSVIAFVGDCELKSKFPENITKGTACFDYIKDFKDELYTTPLVEQILANIEDIRLSRSIKTHIDHVKHVKEIVAEKEQEVEPVSPQEPTASKKTANLLHEEHQGSCSSCLSTNITIKNNYGYKVSCLDCGQTEPFQMSCPDCGDTGVKLKKAKENYRIACQNCSFTTAYSFGISQKTG